jgi:hypothetical protein
MVRESILTTLAYASWGICGLVFIYTILQFTIFFIATARRRQWHMQLHRVRLQRATDTWTVISNSPDTPSVASIILVSLLADSNGIEHLVARNRPNVGWKNACVAAQRRKTGLRELFI